MSSTRTISDRSDHPIHGVRLGLAAFVASYISVFLLAVFYRLDYPWLFGANGPLAPDERTRGIYIPGAVEMLEPHLVVWAAIEFGRDSLLEFGIFKETLPVAVLLPGLSFVFAGIVLGYRHRPASLRSSVGLSAWLLPGYVLPLAVLSTGSLLITFRAYDYTYGQARGIGLPAVFAPTRATAVVIILHAIGLVLLWGTLGVVLSDLIVNPERRKTSTGKNL